VKPKKRGRKHQMVALIPKQQNTEDTEIKDDQHMEAKFINQKEGCSEFEWPINLCNLFNEHDVISLN